LTRVKEPLQTVGHVPHGKHGLSATALIATQNKASTRICSSDERIAKGCHITEAQVHPLTGERVDNMCGIPHQRQSGADH
jgi:translation elongation factor EF-Tu-like GTPase